MGKYVSLELAKKQCIVDQDFHDDDELIETYIGVAEEAIQTEIDMSLSNAVAQNGGTLPKPLQAAMLLYVDYLYSSQRGSNDANPDIPTPILHFCQLYRNWGSYR